MGWYDVVGRRVCSLLHFHNNVYPGSRQAVKRKDPFSRGSCFNSMIGSIMLSMYLPQKEGRVEEREALTSVLAKDGFYGN